MCGQGIQYVTSQKQSPSAIDYLGSMKEAVAIEKRLASVGSSKALKDVLGRCVSEYNKMVTKKAHRVTTEIKNLILNLFPSFNIRITNCFVFIFVDPRTLITNWGWGQMMMCSESSTSITIRIPTRSQAWLFWQSYFQYFLISSTPISPRPVCLPALPVDVLQQDFWVPGSCSRSESSKYAGKPLFKEVLTVTVETCKMWMVRATEDCFLQFQDGDFFHRP